MNTKPELNIRTFGLSIESDNQKIDLIKLVKTFPLNVKLNSSRTQVFQGNNPITCESKECCSTIKNSRINLPNVRPDGYVWVYYSTEKESKDQFLVTDNENIRYRNPPIGPIPIGLWCSQCNEPGPSFHKKDCYNPNYSELRFTINGLLLCLDKFHSEQKINELKKFNESFYQYINKIWDYMKTSKSQEEIISFTNNNIESLLYENEYDKDGWTYTYIPFNLINKKKNEINYFNDCVVTKYNLPNEDYSVSVRFYTTTKRKDLLQPSKIVIISCPWRHKLFYKNVISTLNQTQTVKDIDSDNKENFIVDIDASSVNTASSSFSLTDDEHDIDLKILNEFLRPNSDMDITPVKKFIKYYPSQEKYIEQNYLLLKKNDTKIYYRYDIDYRYDKTTQNIKLVIVPCITNKKTNIPSHTKPYKITYSIYKTGNIQASFSHCKIDKSELCDELFEESNGFNDLFSIIESEFRNAMKFFFQLIKPLSNDLFFSKDKIHKSEHANTVMGIYPPYKKTIKLKLPKHENLEVFNKQTKKWDIKATLIKSIIKSKGNTSLQYLVHIDSGKDKGKEKIIDINDLRSPSQSSTQVGRKKEALKETGNQPVPYSFKGKCSQGEQYFIPFGGKQGYDGYFYPACMKKTPDRYNKYIEHIIEGFPSNPTESNQFKIEMDPTYPDIFSGIFKKGITNIGNTIEFEKNGKVIKGVITKKSKSRGRGFLNTVLYTIITSNNNEYEITGEDFLPKYREDRRWEGVSGNPKVQHEKLLKCAKTNRFNLAQTNYAIQTQKDNKRKEIMTIINHLKKKYGITIFNENTNVLTPKSLKHNMTQTIYMGISFPKTCQRVTLFFHEKKICIINSLGVYECLNNILTQFTKNTCVIDGYIHKITSKNKQYNKLEFYPIDVKVYDGRVLSKSKYYVDPFLVREGKNTYMKIHDDGDEIYDSLNEYINISPNIKIILKNLERGRVMYTLLVSSILQNQLKGLSSPKLRIKDPVNYIFPKFMRRNPIGRIEFTDIYTKSLISSAYNSYAENQQINFLFIPQNSTKPFLRWISSIQVPVILETIKRVGATYEMGVNNKTIHPIGKTLITIPIKYMKSERKNQKKYFKFDLNFKKNGTLNYDQPLILKLNPEAKEKDMLSHKETQNIINAMIYPIPQRIFDNKKEWEILVPEEYILTPSNDLPGINPLIVV